MYRSPAMRSIPEMPPKGASAAGPSPCSTVDPARSCVSTSSATGPAAGGVGVCGPPGVVAPGSGSRPGEDSAGEDIAGEDRVGRGDDDATLPPPHVSAAVDPDVDEAGAGAGAGAVAGAAEAGAAERRTAAASVAAVAERDAVPVATRRVRAGVGAAGWRGGVRVMRPSVPHEGGASVTPR